MNKYIFLFSQIIYLTLFFSQSVSAYDIQSLKVMDGKFPVTLSFKGRVFEDFPILDDEKFEKEIENHPELEFLKDMMGFLAKGNVEKYLASWHPDDRERVEKVVLASPERIKLIKETFSKSSIHIAQIMEYEAFYVITVIQVPDTGGKKIPKEYRILKSGNGNGLLMTNVKMDDPTVFLGNYLTSYWSSRFDAHLKK